ncbi:DUF2157 domain-containing protein [Nitratireductor sp. CAU 1489]|uniref:DUF2157 domain-containing protein n=1 Tax=Nitratireductor arenosus TaxID=2682096 RepID=A0A844QEW4_9HYPH|nr:DUF2157 domain-containing protein [Nitratireductor arenosus]MVA97587.1 DUF2157 domain-containing protein [Nitratireductor arenosus]
MASYAAKLKTDIERWRAEGLVDAATARRLLDDVTLTSRDGISFGAVVAMLAALLLGAAILIFVAANWEALPRLARVGMLFAVILAGYLGGAGLHARGQNGAGEAAYMVAAAAFGGSIALIGQMYHLSGDEAAALLTWCVGVGLAAILLRSPALTAAAVALSVAWLWTDSWDFWRDSPLPWQWLVLATALWVVSLWTASRPARHLLLLALVGYVCLIYLRTELLAVPVVLAVVSAMFLAATGAREAASERMLRLGGGAAVHGLIGFATAMMLIQAEIFDEPAFMLAALATFGGSVAALMVAGRESRVLRWCAYALFTLELGVVYVATVGTMLGTAGFLLAAGLILAAMAAVIIRLEKRLLASASGRGAPS